MLPQLPHFWPCCSDRGTWSSTNMSWRRVCSGDTELKALGMRALRNQHLPDNLTITPLWGRSTDIHHRAAPAGVGSSLNKWRCPTFLLTPWALTRELGADITPWRHWRNSQGRWIRSSQPSESSPLFKPSWSRIAIAHLSDSHFHCSFYQHWSPLQRRQHQGTHCGASKKAWFSHKLALQTFWLRKSYGQRHCSQWGSSDCSKLHPFSTCILPKYQLLVISRSFEPIQMISPLLLPPLDQQWEFLWSTKPSNWVNWDLPYYCKPQAAVNRSSNAHCIHLLCTGEKEKWSSNISRWLLQLHYQH